MTITHSITLPQEMLDKIYEKLLEDMYLKPAPGATKQSICALGFSALFANKKQSTAFKSAILQHARIICPSPVSVVQLVRSKAELPSVRQVALPVNCVDKLSNVLLTQLFSSLSVLQSVELLLSEPRDTTLANSGREMLDKDIDYHAADMRKMIVSSLSGAIDLLATSPPSDMAPPGTIRWDLLVEYATGLLEPRCMHFATAAGRLVIKVGCQSTVLDKRTFYRHVSNNIMEISETRTAKSVPVFEKKDWTLIGERDGRGFIVRPHQSESASKKLHRAIFRAELLFHNPAKSFKALMSLFRSTFLREPSDEEYIRVCTGSMRPDHYPDAGMFNTQEAPEAHRTLGYVIKGQWQYYFSLGEDEDYRFFSYGHNRHNPTSKEIHSRTWKEAYRFLQTVLGRSMMFEHQKQFFALLFDKHEQWPQVTYATPEGE